jgi:hypothetical protein
VRLLGLRVDQLRHLDHRIVDRFQETVVRRRLDLARQGFDDVPFHIVGHDLGLELAKLGRRRDQDLDAGVGRERLEIGLGKRVGEGAAVGADDDAARRASLARRQNERPADGGTSCKQRRFTQKASA